MLIRVTFSFTGLCYNGKDDILYFTRPKRCTSTATTVVSRAIQGINLPEPSKLQKKPKKLRLWVHDYDENMPYQKMGKNTVMQNEGKDIMMLQGGSRNLQVAGNSISD